MYYQYYITNISNLLYIYNLSQSVVNRSDYYYNNYNSTIHETILPTSAELIYYSYQIISP
jgi:hypothetical protein